MNNIINILINYGFLGIAIAAFSEAIFMPIPIELISIPIYLLNTSKAFIYSVILVLFSTIGSMVGYYLGKTLLSKFVLRLNKFVSSENLNNLKRLYVTNVFLTLLTSTFSPIPYEAYVLSAGVFNIEFKKFILSAFISRIIKHLPQGILITLYGDALIQPLKNYTLITSLVILSVLILFKFLSKKKIDKY